ncbi:beta-lactamase family protein [Roseibacterium beibuensis]|uniref:serine hydrolase domain-containing protein n=1 Tax=[Roseibacterium] beibuensis TaxID=1193142 RepID=UPI00217E2C7C|nr:serine hydrolase domain-containing protein [Roseibacterium beibuensis]MCS6622929.1 beta-lactamase family protein [Roseibacterium beibuensis]
MTTSRRSLITCLAALPFAAAPRVTWARDAAPMDAVLGEVFEASAPVALAAAVVTREGVAWSGARGVRRFGQSDPVTRNDRWHLGSNTKAMTAAVLARLIEQGRARWAMPVVGAFPGMTIDPAWSGATLDDFMHHRAGLLDASVMGREWLMTARSDPHTLPEQRAAIVAKALGAPPTGTPGQFAYGNANYVLVGAAIERMTGGAWEDAMRAELFQPLGLSSAGFGPSNGDNAWGHRGAGDQRIAMPPDHPGADNPAALGPAGTAHMTLDDYGRFLAAMMGARPEWLGADSLRRLTTPPAGGPPAYACGWGVARQPWGGVGGPGPVLAHDGSNTMWYCSVAMAPERGLALVTVANDGMAGRQACQALVQRLIPIATA